MEHWRGYFKHLMSSLLVSKYPPHWNHLSGLLTDNGMGQDSAVSPSIDTPFKQRYATWIERPVCFGWINLNSFKSMFLYIHRKSKYKHKLDLISWLEKFLLLLRTWTNLVCERNSRTTLNYFLFVLHVFYFLTFFFS